MDFGDVGHDIGRLDLGGNALAPDGDASGVQDPLDAVRRPLARRPEVFDIGREQLDQRPGTRPMPSPGGRAGGLGSGADRRSEFCTEALARVRNRNGRIASDLGRNAASVSVPNSIPFGRRPLAEVADDQQQAPVAAPPLSRSSNRARSPVPIFRVAALMALSVITASPSFCWTFGGCKDAANSASKNLESALAEPGKHLKSRYFSHLSW